MIYYSEQIRCIEEEELRELLPFLHPCQAERMERFRFPKNRIQFVLGCLLLRYGLIKDYRVLQIPRIEKEEKGKPFLPEYPHIHFNISHCEKAVACGFSHSPLGVDVQHLVPYKESLAGYFMTAEERAEILSGDKEQGFTRLWTLKESYGKCLGLGIGYPMSGTTLIHERSPQGHIMKSHCKDGFWLSVCGWEE